MQWQMILPEILLAAGGLAVLGAGVTTRRREIPAALSAATFVAALVALWPLRGLTAEAWWGMLVVDSFALFFKALFALTGLLVVPLAHAYVERRGIHAGEFYALIVFAVLGMSMMASSRDVLMIYLGLELLS